MLKNRIGARRQRFTWYPVRKMARSGTAIGLYWFQQVVETHTHDDRWVAYEDENGA